MSRFERRRDDLATSSGSPAVLDVFIDRAIQMFQERPINAPLRDDPWRVRPNVRANSPRLDETDLNVEWRELIRERSAHPSIAHFEAQ